MIRIIIYAVIAIVLISLILALINKTKSIFGGEGGGKDIYLREANNPSAEICYSSFSASLNNCNNDKPCLENAAKEWTKCINNA